MTEIAATWCERFRAATESDPVIQSMARFYTCTFLLDMGEVSILVRMDDGQVREIVPDPPPLTAYQFALRASAETWRHFAEKDPPPFFHGFLAAATHHDLRIEGDVTVMMQNLRNFTQHLELLREVGVPLGEA